MEIHRLWRYSFNPKREIRKITKKVEKKIEKIQQE